MNESRLFDLGGAVARVEPADDDGTAIVTFFCPSTSQLPPQEIIVYGLGIEGLLQLAHTLRYWKAKPLVPSSVAEGLQNGATEDTITP